MPPKKRRYALRSVVEACRHAIHAVDSSRVSWPTTLALLHLPPGLQEVDAFSSLAEVGPDWWEGAARGTSWPAQLPGPVLGRLG